MNPRSPLRTRRQTGKAVLASYGMPLAVATALMVIWAAI
jgi:hypothetical protein